MTTLNSFKLDFFLTYFFLATKIIIRLRKRGGVAGWTQFCCSIPNTFRTLGIPARLCKTTHLYEVGRRVVAVTASHKVQFRKHASFSMDCDCITPPSGRGQREMHFAACSFIAEYDDSLNDAFPLPTIHCLH